MEPEISPRTRIWYKTKRILNILVSVIIIPAMAIYITVVPFNHYHYLFTWHVVLGTVAYLSLMPKSFMIFDHVWLVKLTRKHRIWIHAIYVGVASICALACVFLDFYRKEAYKPKNEVKLKHFESAHAITGLISALFLIIATVSGLLTANITRFRKRIAAVRPVTLKLNHNVIGQIAFLIGITSLILAFYTSWFEYYTTLPMRILLTLGTIFVALWSLIGSFVSEYHQVQIALF